MNDELVFAEEEHTGEDGRPAWLVLVVDDEPDIHAVTRLTLENIQLHGRSLRLLNAHNSQEGRALLDQYPDTALILLDVVMEREDAGLLFVRHVRETLGNHNVRIVLRTGQPGIAPAREVVRDFEIDDYRTKTDLTSERLYVTVAAALRTFALLDERQRRERELMQSHQELERFAYVASHDLQTPLRSIVGFTQMLQRRYAAQLDEGGRELLDSVIGSGRSLSVLIRDLLEFSELGQRQRVPGPVALDDLLARARERLKVEAEERQAQLESTPLPVVWGDAVMLEQTFINLIDNGWKFQPGASPRVRIECEESGNMIRLRFIDQGVGIEPGHLDRVLEGFHRLYTQDQFAGTGLGLAICRKVARLHGGQLRAESVPGVGSTFILELPAGLPPR